MTVIKGSKGFTLIELIVVIIILGVVGVFTFQFLASGVQTYITMQKQKDLLDEGRLCLERMSREIRDAEEVLKFFTNDRIWILKSHDTTYDPAKTIVFRYRPAHDDIRRRRIPPKSWDLLAENITTFTMTNTDNEILIRTILSTAGGESLTMGTGCFPRNLKNSAGYKSFYKDGRGNWREKVT
jgi:prepilin-type N-terminal cleavage/methylation domain-containing protein